MHPWLATPPGRYLAAWEQARLDAIVGDIFGFHAVQLGLPELDGLRSNRMPHRWLVVGEDGDLAVERPALPPADGADEAEPASHPGPLAAAVLCDFDALPFASQSLDLVVLPHTLELARDAHEALREVERVLVPEGRVVVLGFNPASLWGLRQMLGRWAMRLWNAPESRALYLPRTGEFIAHRRLRDWLRLLGFEVESSSFGCYRPALRSQRWLERWRWLESTGERWWPVFGAVYLVVAVKRVRGMRLIGLARTRTPAPRAAPAVATHRHHRHHRHSPGR